MITIALNDHGLMARLGNLSGQAIADVAQVVGREAANRIKDHYQIKDATEPNQLGGKREHFWLQVMKSVNNPIVQSTPDGATIRVAVSDPRIAQKVFGGTIAAKQAKALTIPVAPEAYGRTASTFEAEVGPLVLVVVGGKKNNPFARAVLALAQNGHLTAEYLLTPSVTQAPDPTALPDRSTLTEQLLVAAQSAVDRIGGNPAHS